MPTVSESQLQDRVRQAPAPEVMDLAAIFDREFASEFNTLLIPGAQEPFYQCAKGQHDCHRIFSTRDYFASALHEVAHWCIAGPQRRLQDDYGYWYAPDGRDADRQAEFFRVEVRPQALEWAFSLASNSLFRISADNLSGAGLDTTAFAQDVARQLQEYARQGFPPRADRFIKALCRYYRQGQAPAFPEAELCLKLA